MACLKNQKWYNTNPAGRGSARIERTVRDREVGGPNPPAPTKEPSRNRGFFLLCESGFGTEPLTGCFAKVGGPNPPAPTKEPSRNRGFFLLCESGFGTEPLTGCFAKVGGPNPPAPTVRGCLQIDEATSLFLFGTEPLAGSCAKVGDPNPPAPTEGPSRNRGFFLLCESGFGTEPLTGCFAKVGGPNPPAPTVRGCLQIDEATSLFLFGTEPLAGSCAKVGDPNPPAPTEGPSRNRGFFLLCESGFGTEPLTGCFAKVGGPNPTEEPFRDGGFFLLIIRVRDRALDRVMREGRRSKSARPDSGKRCSIQKYFFKVIFGRRSPLLIHKQEWLAVN